MADSKKTGNMLGAIAGDIIGSIYEHHNINKTDFPLFDPRCRFTDDTVMTVAVADAILNGTDYGEKLREWYRLYPERGYGPDFRRWAASETTVHGYSMGNGAAMRVSPVGIAFDSLEKVLKEARKSAEPSHSHPEGIKGAQAVASAVFLARTGSTKAEIKEYIERGFAYNLSERLDKIREHYRFDATCPGSVPQAMIAFLESDDYEDSIRKAVALGGDSDTIACIAGGIAHAFYKTIPAEIVRGVMETLDERLKTIVDRFMERFHLQDQV